MASDGRFLILDSNSDRRARLREVLKELLPKANISHSRSFQEALAELQTHTGYDCIFFSSSFRADETRKFLRDLAQLTLQPSPLLIVSLLPSDQGSAVVADLYVHGVHGFICEPFSSDGLWQLMNTTRQEAEKAIDNTEKDLRITGFLVADAMRLLDEIADARSEGRLAPGYTGKLLREVSAALKASAEKIGREALEEILISKFMAAKTSKVGPDKGKIALGRKREVVHPGVEIEKIMEQRKLSKDKLLSVLKIEPAEFDQILAQQSPVTKELARELARVLGRTQEYWLEMQNDFDRQQKEKQAGLGLEEEEPEKASHK